MVDEQKLKFKDVQQQQASPSGIKAFIVVGLLTLVMCLTGQTIAAVDPMQELMRLNGAYSWILDPVERMTAIKSVIGLGVSCSALSGVLVGLVLDTVGPKMTAIFGMTFQSAGMYLLFFQTHPSMLYIGSILLGFAFQAILTSHISASVLFPRNIAVVLALMGSAPDVSLFLPARMLSMVESRGADSVHRVVGGYIVICVGCCLVIDMLYVPWRPFGISMRQVGDGSEALSEWSSSTGESSSSYGSVCQYCLNPRPSSPRGVVPHLEKSNGHCRYWNYSLRGQLKTIHYWVFLPFFIMNFCRRKYFAANIRDIFSHTSGSTDVGNKWATVFNALVPFGFIPAICWGMVSDTFGVMTSLFLSNFCGVSATVFAMLSIPMSAALTILFYLLNSSYTYGILFAFLATTYGMLTLPSLQGIASTIAGVASLFMDAVVFDFITTTLNNNYFVANCIVLVIGLLLFLVSLFFYLNPPPLEGDDVEPPKDSAERLSVEDFERHYDTLRVPSARSFAIYGIGSRPSMRLMRGDIKKKSNRNHTLCQCRCGAFVKGAAPPTDAA